MKGKKVIFLFLALLLPVFVFVFLKLFGKNEFRVAPLFVTELPVVAEGCSAPTLPYYIPESVMQRLGLTSDTLALVIFGSVGAEGETQLNRIREEFGGAYKEVALPADTTTRQWQHCVFYLPKGSDLALVNSHGVIRGQYESNDLAEMDRLIDELTIILKRY